LPGPLEGRRLFFVGIGGAGLSAYAQLARAWGAEVAGWDRHHTRYLDALGAIPVEVSDRPQPPTGFELVVSAAYPQIAGTTRAAFLAELVALRRSIVVAGTHGKGTTAAMIAYCLCELGADPAWLIGAPVPQLGGNAGAGEGWLVVEGDESDRTVFGLQATIGVITNVELDHHSEWSSLAELEAAFAQWAGRVGQVVEHAPPYDGPLALPGALNRANAGAALAALELAGVARAEAAGPLARFGGTARRFEVCEVAGVTIVDDYGHHPGEIAATIAAARESYRDRPLRVLFQPHLVSRTRHLAAELAAALAAADEVIVCELYPAREQAIAGVSGKLVIDALSDLGMLALWIPDLERAAELTATRSRPGDVDLVVGAGDIERAPALIAARLAERAA
jgi:UDP-N-acetylmuramate--alanine ligase